MSESVKEKRCGNCIYRVFAGFDIELLGEIGHYCDREFEYTDPNPKLYPPDHECHNGQFVLVPRVGASNYHITQDGNYMEKG